MDREQSRGLSLNMVRHRHDLALIQIDMHGHDFRSRGQKPSARVIHPVKVVEPFFIEVEKLRRYADLVAFTDFREVVVWVSTAKVEQPALRR